MNFWNSIAGMVEAELTSADIPGAFDALNQADITVFSVQGMDDLTARLTVRRKDFDLLSALAEKRGETLKVIRQRGIFWLGKRLLKRPVLMCGMTLLLVAAMLLPTRVLFIRVEGNAAVPTRLILSAAEESGIRFGASRREVRSEKVKNALLELVPQLQWAGVNTAGCVATISVRERSAEEEIKEETGISSIVAARDGVILSITATSGNPLCQLGQAVREGQILISGYTDCGICIQATRAEGEIFAGTSRKQTAAMPSEYLAIREKTAAGRKFSLLIGKKRINLWKDSGISEGTCGRMYEEYYITLPGGFVLPLALCCETFYSYATAAAEWDPTEAEQLLSNFSDSYLYGQMVAGSILGVNRAFDEADGSFRMTGTYLCTEMIGRVQREQIGETNGKNS